MPSLHVRDLPEEIYHSLCAEAVLEHRSIAQQAVAVLARGLKMDGSRQRRRAMLLAKIQADDHGRVYPDPVALIREDRER